MTLYISTAHPEHRKVAKTGAHRRATRWDNLKERIRTRLAGATA